MKSENKQYLQLKNTIKNYNSVSVAFSGGVDSALVLKVAFDVLGEKAIGITADSPSVPRREIENAIKSGLVNKQRSLGFHASTACADMLEMLLHKNSLIRPWFCH